jgi:hypothetical protein
MKDLLKKGINSVLVEGGYLTLQHFLERHLWDEIRVFTGVRKFGTGTPAPCPPNIPSQSMKTGTDLLEIFFNPPPSEPTRRNKAVFMKKETTSKPIELRFCGDPAIQQG